MVYVEPKCAVLTALERFELKKQGGWLRSNFWVYMCINTLATNAKCIRAFLVQTIILQKNKGSVLLNAE